MGFKELFSSLFGTKKADEPSAEAFMADIEQKVQNFQIEVVRAEDDFLRNKKKVDSLRGQVQSWLRAAQLALEQGERAKAEAYLTEKKKADDELAELEVNLDKKAQRVAELKAKLRSMEEELANSQQEHHELDRRLTMAKAEDEALTAMDRFGMDGRQRLDDLKEQVQSLESRNKAMTEMRAATHPGQDKTDTELIDSIRRELEGLAKEVKQ